MQTRTLAALSVATAALLLVIHSVVKPEPDPEEIRREAQTVSNPRLWVGRVAPEIELPLLDGGTFRLSDHIGKQAVVLNFFATWCGPCKAEMPELERYARSLHGEPFILVGIDVEETRAVVQRFIDGVKTSFPIALDETGSIGEQFSVGAFPTTIVIGADGRVALYETGAILNADVSLGGIIGRELEVIAAGNGIALDDYRTALRQQPPLPTSDEQTKEQTPLSARALAIAGAMDCPCGCDDKVSACSCRTAKGIKARLAKNEFDGRTDAEIMRELNAEFCMKGM